MPGLTATLSLDASKYEARWKAIVSETVEGQQAMATSAEIAAARQVKVIEERLASAEKGSAQYIAIEQERAKAMAKFAVAVERAPVDRAREAYQQAAATHAQALADVEANRAAVSLGGASVIEAKAAYDASEAHAIQTGAILAQAKATLLAGGVSEGVTKAQVSSNQELIEATERYITLMGRAAPTTKEAAQAALLAARADHAVSIEKVAAARAAVAFGGANDREAATALADAEAHKLLTASILAKARAEALAIGPTEAESAASLEAAAAAEAEAVANASANKGLGQLFTVLRDIARGQWTRAFTTLSSLIQGLVGESLIALLPLIGVLAAVGAVGYFAIRTFRRMADGAEAMADSVELATTRLKAHVEAMREASKEAQSFKDWQDKLHAVGRRDDNLLTQAEADVKALKKKFELEHPHATEAQRKKEAHDEAGIYRYAADKQAKRAKDAELNAIDIEKNTSEQLAQKREDAAVSRRAADDTADMLGALVTSEDYQKTRESTGSAIKFMDIDFEYKGKTVTATESALRKQLDATTSQNDADAATVKALEDKREKAKSDATREAELSATLSEKANSSGDVAAAAASATPPSTSHGVLTELQKVGAYIGPSQGGIQIQRKISHDVTAILHQLLKQNGPHGHSSVHNNFE